MNFRNKGKIVYRICNAFKQIYSRQADKRIPGNMLSPRVDAGKMKTAISLHIKWDGL